MAQVSNNPERFPDNSILGVRLRYIAILNPNGVNKLAYQYGYHVPQDKVGSRIGFLNRFIADEGEDAMTELLSIHPDKELILDNVIDEVKSDNDRYSNWIDTIVGVSGKKYNNYEEQEESVITAPPIAPSPIINTPVSVKRKESKKEIKDIPWLGITAIIAITVVVLAVINKKL
jgi:hypothetical protein